MPNSGPGAKIEGFMGSLINPSRHGDGEAASYGGAIEGDAYQYEREEAPQDRDCDVGKLSFMLETRARRSLGIALGDAQSLVEGRATGRNCRLSAFPSWVELSHRNLHSHLHQVPHLEPHGV